MQARLIQQTWIVEETLTAYYQPGDQSRHSSFNVFNDYPPGHMRMALLANGASCPSLWLQQISSLGRNPCFIAQD